jgi:hypothetical protein
MHQTFKWGRRGDRRIIAELLDLQSIPPKISTDVKASCTLTLFTHVAEVKTLTEHLGFVAQKLESWTNHRFFEIHSSRDDGSGCASILLDSGTQSPDNNKYKMACIGKGRRGHPKQDNLYMQNTWLTEDDDDRKSEWVVLLLQRRAKDYERIGLTTVQPNDFEWTLEWIDIV